MELLRLGKTIKVNVRKKELTLPGGEVKAITIECKGNLIKMATHWNPPGTGVLVRSFSLDADERATMDRESHGTEEEGQEGTSEGSSPREPITVLPVQSQGGEKELIEEEVETGVLMRVPPETTSNENGGMKDAQAGKPDQHNEPDGTENR